MNPPDEILERLINRRLDGELSPAESQELDSRIGRDPEARRWLEELAVIDRLAAQALRQACAAPGRFEPSRAAGFRSRRRSLWWALVPTAAAACLALALIWPEFSPRDTESPRLVRRSPDPETFIATEPSQPGSIPSVRLANHSADSLRQKETKVDYYGVLDEAQHQLYLLEVRQTTSRQRADRRSPVAPQGRVMLTSGDM